MIITPQSKYGVMSGPLVKSVMQPQAASLLMSKNGLKSWHHTEVTTIVLE